MHGTLMQTKRSHSEAGTSSVVNFERYLTLPRCRKYRKHTMHAYRHAYEAEPYLEFQDRVEWWNPKMGKKGVTMVL